MPSHTCRIARGLIALLAAATYIGVASAGVSVLTERYDNSRTGANLNETMLSPSSVSPSTFGKLWAYTVSGSVQAQPLYVANLYMPGYGVRNVLYVVTMNDIVYAFDADSSSNTPLWSDNLPAATIASPVSIDEIIGVESASSENIVGNVGIESTPVIDMSTHTMYLVTRTMELGQGCENCVAEQKLHALDITTGKEKFGGPVVIFGSVPGSGDNTSTVTFNELNANQRPGLALANGQIYIAWASHEDKVAFLPAWHGWIMSYNASTLQQTGIFCTTPNSSRGGIWMSGRAPAIDAAGNVYYMTGNGPTSGGYNGVNEFSESLLKFSPSVGIGSPVDWFTPSSWLSLDQDDTDFGGSGPMLLPGTNLVIGGGKGGTFYLTSTTSLGHEQFGDTQIAQVLNNNGGEIKSGPVYWNRMAGGGVGNPWMYAWSDGGDVLKAYTFVTSSGQFVYATQGNLASPAGNSGGVLTLTANGGTPQTGIVWSSMPLNADADGGVHQGVLRAYNADNLSQELWDSSLSAADNMGNWPKFSPPTVANGRVYMGSFPSDGMGSTSVTVYGLLNVKYPSPAAVVMAPIINYLLSN